MPFNKEEDFELALVDALSHRGWAKEVLMHPSEQDLIQNWADILFDNNNQADRLNGARLTPTEMQQLLDQVNELRTPQKLNGFINGKTASIRRDNPADPPHLGREISLKLFDPHEIAAGQSRYQIVRQPRFASPSPLSGQRRGDVMLLINGMPVIHIELKRSGVDVTQATNQIEKYSKEGIFAGLFSLIQIFVAMTPEETLYFANPGREGRFNKLFYFHWADFNNTPVNDWKEIATYLLSIPMAHQLIGYYTIADRTDGVLKVLRSYQFNAVRCISDRVARRRDWTGSDNQLGGYIWHTTGSGKTMSSFKAAQLIADSGNADKVIFIIDRIELGTQSAREYRNFSAADEAVQETENTDALTAKMKSPDTADTLIVSSIQKLGIIADGGIRPADLQKINRKRIVFIVDECHRSTFGDSFRAIKAAFPTAMFFGFTGTPIHQENQRRQSTTIDIFGNELHRYSIADGIRDGNVLGFDPCKVLTYKEREVREQVALHEAGANSTEEIIQDPAKQRIWDKFMQLPMAGRLEAAGQYVKGVEDYLPSGQYETGEHCLAVVSDIIENWHRISRWGEFHGILATTSIPQAIKYYRLFKQENPSLKVTALFDPSLDNDNPTRVLAKEAGLEEIIRDYNARYGMTFTVPTHAKFKKDLASRLAHKAPYIGIERPENVAKRLDLLIVVSQMLTGFDSKWVNALYVDKLMEYADLIQAFSRTNRLFGPEKPFGIIRYYHLPNTMERNVGEAVQLYSGNRPLGLFVSKLDVNVAGMNTKFQQIRLLFEGAGISNFSHLPEETVLKARFAVLFREYVAFLEAAQVQGFNWTKKSYPLPTGGSVTINHSERQYLTLVQRYKELFAPGTGGGGGGPADAPYEIDTHITEIDTGKIDSEYMDRNFRRYLKALEQPDVTQDELDKLLSELSDSFASLPQEQQRYAEILLHDVQCGNIRLEPDKSFRDYIADYMTSEKDRRVATVARVFGLDHALLDQMLNLPVTQQNIDEFGRFTRLLQSVDRDKAREYFKERTGMSLPLLKLNIEIDKALRRFVIQSGNCGLE